MSRTSSAGRPKVADEVKINAMCPRCPARCPVCGRTCIGGPPRYLWRHTCLDLHQWLTYPPER